MTGRYFLYTTYRDRLGITIYYYWDCKVINFIFVIYLYTVRGASPLKRNIKHDLMYLGQLIFIYFKKCFVSFFFLQCNSILDDQHP